MKESHSVDAPFSEQMLDLFLEGKLVDYFVFDDGLIELLLLRGGPQDQPEILILLGAGREVYGRDPFFFLIQVLSLVVNEEVVSHDLVLLAESVLEGDGVCSQPLIRHFMFDEDSLIDPDGLPCRLQPNIGVRML